MPEHEVHTKEPTVIFAYVGPRWSQSKHFLLGGKLVISLSIFRCFSSCFRFALDAMVKAIFVLNRNRDNLQDPLKLEQMVVLVCGCRLMAKAEGLRACDSVVPRPLRLLEQGEAAYRRKLHIRVLYPLRRAPPPARERKSSSDGRQIIDCLSFYLCKDVYSLLIHSQSLWLMQVI